MHSSHTSSPYPLGLPLLAALVVGACSGQSATQSTAAAQPKPAAQTVVHKANAPTALVSHQLDQVPQPGQPLNILLRFQPEAGAQLQVRYTASQGLEILDQPQADALPTGPSEQRVRVRLSNAGTAYLNVFLTTAAGASSAHAVAVSSDAAAAAPPPGPVQKAADGERLIVLPVR